MSDRSPPALPLALAFVLLSFSLNSLITRVVVANGLLDPGLVTFLRFAAGAAALIPLAVARGEQVFPSPVPTLWLGAYAVAISFGYAFITAAAGTFVFYACNLATLVVGGAVGVGRRAVGRGAVAPAAQRPTPTALVGCAVALLGVATLAVGHVAGTTLTGVLMLAATGVAWGLYTLHARRAASPLAFTTSAFAGLALALLVPTGAYVALRPGIAITLTGVLLTIVMGAITTALAYVAWSFASKRIGAAQAGAYQLAIPVLTAGLAIVMLREPFSWPLLVAGVLVVAGMWLATPRAR